MLAATVERSGSRRIYAFVEIAMPKGWKTYWRNPGDAGGLPPRFDWSRSDNLEKATVLYPAPLRLSDEAGDTIGYKDSVTFPVAIEAKDASKPVRLVLELTFGICKDICVPSEATHELVIAPDATGATSTVTALEHVPRAGNERHSGDPELKSAALETKGATPLLVIDVVFPGGAEGGDVFVEAPDGLYVPMLKRAETGGGVAGSARFTTELGNLLEPKDLKGKTLTATIVSPLGSAVTTFTLP